MSQLFTDQENTALTGLYHQAAQASKNMTLDRFNIALHGLVTVFVVGFEWELAYTLFAKIGGDDDTTWNPFIMGLSALVLVLGFHYMVETKTGQKAKGFIDWLAAKVLPIYAIGFGLVVLLLLLKDGLLAMLQADDEVFELVDTLSTAPASGDWFSTIIAQFVTPSAALAFAVGVGTLAVINIFVAHSALGKIKSLINQLNHKRHIKRESDIAKATIKALAQQLTDKQDALDEALQQDENTIAAELAADIHATLQEAMLRPQLWLERAQNPQHACFEQKKPPHPRLKSVEARVQSYEALTLEAIIAQLQHSETAQ